MGSEKKVEIIKTERSMILMRDRGGVNEEMLIKGYFSYLIYKFWSFKVLHGDSK